jgi:hypothetical protein
LAAAGLFLGDDAEDGDVAQSGEGGAEGAGHILQDGAVAAEHGADDVHAPVTRPVIVTVTSPVMA